MKQMVLYGGFKGFGKGKARYWRLHGSTNDVNKRYKRTTHRIHGTDYVDPIKTN